MFPYEILDVEDEKNEELKNFFKGQRDGYCTVGPKKWFFPQSYREHAEAFYNFKLQPDDIWIVTFPRSGTTLTQEMIWLINNDLDFETALKVPQIERFPYIEYTLIQNKKYMDDIKKLNGYQKDIVDALDKRNIPGYILAEKIKSPRFLKSHLPFDLLPPKLVETCKVVYVARNPKDAAVSFYHLQRHFNSHNYVGDFFRYWDYFEKGSVMYTPYWEHVREGWEKRNHPNLLFLFYEDLVSDMSSSIRKVASFYGKSLTNEQVEKLKNFLDFENFKKIPRTSPIKIEGLVNKDAEGFIRRGKIGGNKEYTDEIEEKANKWLEENLSSTDLKFPYH